MRGIAILGLVLLGAMRAGAIEASHVIYEGTDGPGAGKHIVFIASDHEYRGEETLPAMARILGKRYGFHCEVIFGIDPADGSIKPGSSELHGLSVLDKADLLVICMRFINMADDEMQHFVDYVDRGGPIVGLRTSTHAFNIPKDRKFAAYDYRYLGPEFLMGFGRQVLGETWVTHYGENHKQSSNLTIAAGAENDPILRGVGPMHVMAGCYTANPMPGSNILVRATVLNGMEATSPVDATKQPQPVAWTRSYASKSGKAARIFTTTQGASQDLVDANFRRLLLNACLWGLGMDDAIKPENPIDFVGPFNPTTFSFTEYRHGVHPADLAGWDTPIMNPDAPLK